MTTSEFIAQNRLGNPRELALQSRRYPDVDMAYALNQIQGWQTARHKLPSWAECDGVAYPPHINMEQCSSEPTARYKQEVARRWLARTADGTEGSSMTDLTGGFGVDFSFTSRCFDRATYVERDAALCSLAESNLPRLGIGNARVERAEAEAWLATMEPQTMLFLDPARRDANGAKTVFIADCTPDACELLPQLLAKSRFTMLKLSPMLDWHKAVADLGGAVAEVHVVSVGGECKELLLVLSAATAQDGGGRVGVRCIDLQPRPNAEGRYERSEFAFAWSLGDCAAQPLPCPAVAEQPRFIYEPNASVMKAGCFGEIARAFGVVPVGQNSHLFLSHEWVEGFPGRAFAIDATTTMNRRQLRQAIGSLGQANIAVRNFPMSAAELRKRLKLRDGGDAYIFATTDNDGTHLLYIAHKPSAMGGT